MDPTTALTGLFTLPFLVFCTIIGLIVYGLRRVVELFAKQIAPMFPDKYEPWWKWVWYEIILPTSPLAIGAALSSIVKDYPYPDPFNGSDSSRLFIGLIAGFVSGFLYPRVMFYLKKYSVAKIDETASGFTTPEE